MIDNKALFNIEYGLYVVTTLDEDKDNGMISNSACQVSVSPDTIAITLHKSTYTHDIIKKTGILNLCPIEQTAPFSLFENFGFKSGREHNKFESYSFNRSSNGLAVLDKFINSYISLQVVSYFDMNSHGMFICKIVEAKTLSTTKTMTYSYYHENVKNNKQDKKSKGFVCSLCGYVYENDTLPADFVCPLCNHGAQFFEEIK